MNQPNVRQEDGKSEPTAVWAASDVFDRLAEEFAERCRRGESPSISEYEARYPEYSEKIRSLLPTVALVEQLKRSPKGRTALGEAAPPMPDRLGEFRVLRELGRGGMGIVYEAVQESLGRHVALKVVHHLHLDSRRLQRFQREAQAVAQLHHTNIVPIFGVGEDDGLPYCVMQYIEGRGLDRLIENWRHDGSLEGNERWRFVAQVGAQVADALHYAHEQGVLHRDVKPANLLIDGHGTVWVTDFGLAKLTGHDDLTASGDVIGTLRYLAPEALKGASDPRSDLYSLGLTLYELLTLSPPFGELTPSELLRQVSEGHLPRPTRFDRSIPRDLETIVLKAIAREPGHRYPSAGALADDLKRFLDDRPIQARRVGMLERAWRWSRRNPATAVMTAAAAGSLMLAAAVGGYGYAKTHQALGRADATVDLSLQVFSEVFDKLTADDMSLLPPPPGRHSVSGPHGGGERFSRGPRGQGPPRPPLNGESAPGGPGDGAEPPPPPGFGPGDLLSGGPGFGPPPPEFDDGPPPDEPGDGGPGDPGRRGEARGPFGPGGGPPDGGRGGPHGPPPGHGRGPFGGGPFDGGSTNSENTAHLLESILKFYDRFGQLNERNPNPKLQAEAAWAFRKVGAIDKRLGREQDAALATDRAIKMLEELVKQSPNDLEFRSKLVDTYIMANPWQVDPAGLERLHEQLAYAGGLVDQLVDEVPKSADYLQAQVHVYAKLGAVEERLGHAGEAEAYYRKALDAGQSLIALIPPARRDRMDGRARTDRVFILESLAVLLFDQGRKDETRTALEAAVAEVPRAGDRWPARDSVQALTDLFRKLGDTKRADEVARTANSRGRAPHREARSPQPTEGSSAASDRAP
jgi:tRNA A-37 threonylcarbamoyl transferase component Bud32/tetratricopeptide (TPR) repeat protein